MKFVDMLIFSKFCILCTARNRIALIQKEEERARKKIEQTKERAVEILALRNDTQKRVSAYKAASGEVKQLQQIMLAKNREQEEESKRARQFRLESLQAKKKGGVVDMLMEKKYLTQMMIHEQEKEIQMKQKRRLEIKRMEEEARVRKEQERIEKEAKVKEYFAQKLAEEAAEAKRAEKLVRELEKKEKEWIAKLRNAQIVQEDAFDQLETALHKDGNTPPSSNRKASSNGFHTSMDDSPKELFRSSGGRDSKESAGGHDHQRQHQHQQERGYYSESAEQQARLADLSTSMSEMNMSDPVDGIRSSHSHSLSQQQAAPSQGRGSAGASQASRGSRDSASRSRDEEMLKKSTMSGLTKSSAGAGSARGSSSAGSAGSGPKKKVVAPAGKKAH